MEITGESYIWKGNGGQINDTGAATGAFYGKTSVANKTMGDNSGWGWSLGFQASRAWTGTTNTAQPQTVNLGKGTAFSILPPYLVVNIWKRLS